jgi:hypothetical protein
MGSSQSQFNDDQISSVYSQPAINANIFSQPLNKRLDYSHNHKGAWREVYIPIDNDGRNARIKKGSGIVSSYTHDIRQCLNECGSDKHFLDANGGMYRGVNGGVNKRDCEEKCKMSFGKGIHFMV